jgi:hypothetical protein
MNKTTISIIASALLFAGCNASPFSPVNRQRINNSGEIGDSQSIQNGLAAEVMSLKNKVDLMARDVENLQSGLVNTNNRNFGVQIFHGEGGLAAGVVIIMSLAALALNYKFKSDRYRKTAEIFGQQLKNINSEELEEKVFEAAIAKKVESDVYRILKG